ncbi:MAG: hypothetical protein ACYCUG_06900 [Acidimicrobiales bacterium]
MGALIGAGPAAASPAPAQAVFNPGTGLSTNWDWARLLLEDGGWPVTAGNETVLTQWMASEEPPTDWWNRDNPLNGGYGNGGGSGLGSYPDLATAAYYVVANLDFGDYGYGAITADLARSAPPATTAKAIWASSWAGGHYANGADWYTGTPPTVAAPIAAWTPQGELVQVTGTSTTWEAVGGALLYVAPQEVGALAARAGQTAPLGITEAEAALFGAVPANGTVMQSLQSGQYFVVAGGAALYAPHCAVLPGCATAVVVDGWNVTPANFGTAGDRLAAVPAGGSALLDAETGVGYIVAGGAPLPVASWSDVPGAPAPVTVDDWDVANAGVRGIKPFDDLSRRPAAGTALRGSPSGRAFVVDAAGHAVYQASPPPAAVTVDEVAIDRAGGGGMWDHLVNAVPAVAFTPAQVSTPGSTVVVHYPMPVLSSALRAVSVRYRVRNPGRAWGVWLMPKSWRMTVAPDVTYNGLGVGQTVCFEVRATDVDGVDSAWTGDRCWTRR